MRHRITFLKHVDDALWLVVRCARAVRFPVTKLNLAVVSGLRCGDFCVNTEPTPRR